MDLLKAQLERIQKQLAGLSASQKMLVAALSAIMVITVIWWGKYAGEAEMVPLLPQSFSAAEMGGIQEWLGIKSYTFSVSGDKLLVPADRRMEILSGLTYAHKMPRNTTVGFDEIVKEMSPFDSQDKQQKIWNHGKEVYLAQMIGTFPGVARADVVIDTTSVMRIQDSVEPSATVNIGLEEGVKSTRNVVDAAADLLCGAVAGINASRIRVVVNGVPERVHDTQDAIANGSDQLMLLQQNELNAETKIQKWLADVPNALVTVTMKLNTATTQTEKVAYDAKNAISKPVESTSETDTTSGGGPGGEAGAIPNASNVPVSASAPTSTVGAAGPSQQHEKTDDKMQNFVGQERTTSQTPAGDATMVSAAIRLPVSYFARLFQARTGSTQMPTYAQLQPVMEQEEARIRQGVANCIALQSPDKITVTDYPDAFPTMAAPPVASTSAAGLSLMVGGHAKEIALGTLAVISLFMASMMVRKASPGPVPAASMGDNGASAAAPVLAASEPPVDDAGEGEAHLEGMELDDDAVKSGRMVDQVSSLVRENPEAAAALVKRWLART